MAETMNPVLNDLSRPFYEAAEAGQLVLPHCEDKGRAFWPPSPSSPFVTGGAVAWRPVEAKGSVLSVVVYHRAFQQALSDRMPFAIALVELESGVRLQAHVADAGSIHAGDPVRLGFDRLAADAPPVLHARPLS